MKPDILWTKVYKFFHAKGDFNIITAEHEGKVFYATVMYYVKEKDPTEQYLGILNFDTKNFTGTNKEQVYAEAKKWVDENFGTEYTIVEKDI